MSPTRPANLPEPVFRVASPRGELPFLPDMAGLPLEGCPLCTSYGEYFAGLREFCLGPGREALLAGASRAVGRPLAEGEVTALVITAQKHGALYHPASIEVRFPGGAALFGANVAASPHGWAALGREHDVLARLTREIPGAGLPRPLCHAEGDRLDILLVEWFAGFHEFHVTSGGQVMVWDFEGGGLRPLAPAAAREVYRQAARLLTLGLDLETGARIAPWRHAAGDFVVKSGAGGVETRLITARGHAPPIVGGGEAGLTHFFLTTTLFMRLDRLDGVGERVFLPDWCLDAAVSGILSGLAGRPEAAARFPDPAALLRGVSPRAWRELLDADADFRADPDAPFLFSRLDGHLAGLSALLAGGGIPGGVVNRP